MANNLYDQFRKVEHFGENKLLTEVELNLKWYLDWSFLKIGAWKNVESGVTQGYFGGNFYELKPVHDPSYTDGQVWEGIRKDWVFETGVDYQTKPIDIVDIVSTGGGSGTINLAAQHYFDDGTTIIISDNTESTYNSTFTIFDSTSTSISVTGIAVNGTGTGGNIVGQFNPFEAAVNVNDNTAPAHHINYPLGRVIFDTALNTGTSTVVAQYSYRDVQTYIADSVPWLVEFQFDSFRSDQINWNNIDFINKGEWAMNAPHRIQLPAVVVEAVDYRGGQPFELGNLSSLESPQVIFHVIAENRFDRNNLVNILMEQKHHTIWLFDSDEVHESDHFPLDFRGEKVDSPKMYENVVSPTGHRWIKCWWKEINSSNISTQNPNFHYARVRTEFEVISVDKLN